MDLGSTPSGHSDVLCAPELPLVGPAFSSGAQSLFQSHNLAFLLQKQNGSLSFVFIFFFSLIVSRVKFLRYCSYIVS